MDKGLEMTKLVTTPFDAAKYMTEPEDVVDFLNDAFDSGHAPYIAKVLGLVARSEGMTKLATKTGVNRQALYTALSEQGNPTLETLLKVLAALGMKLKCEADRAKAA
jgi:probable addiction module antidote protein